MRGSLNGTSRESKEQSDHEITDSSTISTSTGSSIDPVNPTLAEIQSAPLFDTFETASVHSLSRSQTRDQDKVRNEKRRRSSSGNSTDSAKGYRPIASRLCVPLPKQNKVTKDFIRNVGTINQETRRTLTKLTTTYDSLGIGKTLPQLTNSQAGLMAFWSWKPLLESLTVTESEQLTNWVNFRRTHRNTTILFFDYSYEKYFVLTAIWSIQKKVGTATLPVLRPCLGVLTHTLI